MSGTEQDPVGWLREQVESDLGIARHILDKRGSHPDPRREMYDAIADCEAKLAILDEHRLVVADPGGPEQGQSAGSARGYRIVYDRPTAEQIASADLTWYRVAYRHREGWRPEWAA